MTTAENPGEVGLEQPLSSEEEIEQILENVPSEIEISIDLPSKNKFYILKDPAAPISVRPMTFEDEKVLASNTNREDGVNLLLERCVTNIDISQLLLMDKLSLILKIREISFGDKYTIEHICGQCNAKNELTFSINEFTTKYVEDDLTDPQEVELPTLKKTVKVRLPRIADESLLSNPNTLFENLWHFVLDIGGNTKKSVISKVIQRLPVKDFHVLTDLIFGLKYGIDLRGQFKCDSCQNVSIAEIPFTENFFSVS